MLSLVTPPDVSSNFTTDLLVFICDSGADARCPPDHSSRRNGDGA
jgi:hypothetical protein